MYSRLIKKQYLELVATEPKFLHPLEKRYDHVEKELAKELNREEQNSPILEHLATTKMIVGTRISLEQRTAIFLLMLLVLSHRIDKISSRKGGLTKREREAEENIDKHLAKRLSELLDMKGHEAMYDTGTKPSRSN